MTSSLGRSAAQLVPALHFGLSGTAMRSSVHRCAVSPAVDPVFGPESTELAPGLVSCFEEEISLSLHHRHHQCLGRR